ncbi:triose-phosphate isomerase [Aureimonas flava]|uniref:Triosephosphate isomerase n=1 Tax=Aureimonas flava TaxID=2320271 RepID=A0A3A1WTK3_9HYPH|nr:triose-phosphate isomerase [Aureimonas flava]RIY01584.1 triose-phosphate isomerase [Aureimonas flava]
MSRTPLIAGNWKMNGSRAALSELSAMVDDLREAPADGIEVLICPPVVLVAAAVELAGGVVAIGGQDAHAKASGAHTGDVSAAMLKDAGASHVILGHSERRTDHGEASELVAAKAEGAWAAGLVAVVCIGETEAEKNAGRTLDVLGDQIRRSLPDGTTPSNTVVAYEPVWAIGTGRTPTVAEVGETHAFIRRELARRFGAATANGLRVLYGGSVKASNAAELLALEDVDGALVGGASLKAGDFLPICRAARA